MDNHSPIDPLHPNPSSIDPLDLFKDLMPEEFSLGDLSPEEQEAVHSLFGAMLPQNLTQSVAPFETQSDRDLLKHLQHQVQEANTIVDLLAQREIGKSHLPTMRRLELQIAALTPNLFDLEQGLEGQPKQAQSSVEMLLESGNRSYYSSNKALESILSSLSTSPETQPSKKIDPRQRLRSLMQSLKPVKASQFWLNLTPRTRWTIFACLIAALTPIAIRWGGPRLIYQAEQTGLIKDLIGSTTSTVKTIDGNTWIISPPNQPIQSLQLAGIEPIDPSRIAESNSILRMIVFASDNQVSVTVLPHSSRAILRLPTGLMLQEVLVRQGFAKIDPNQLNSLPKDTVASLEQAQAKAKAQHQNLWSNE